MPQVRINGQDFIVVLLADPLTGLPIQPAGDTAGVTFCDQAVISVTGTPVPLPAHAMTSSCIVKSLSSNSAARQTTSLSATLSNATAGASGATAGYILEPGEAAPYAASTNLTNTNQIYVNGQQGDIFSIIGS